MWKLTMWMLSVCAKYKTMILIYFVIACRLCMFPWNLYFNLPIYLHHLFICSYFKFLGPHSAVLYILLLAGLEISEICTFFNILQKHIFALEIMKFIEDASVLLYQNSIENNCLRSWITLGQWCLWTRTVEDLALSEHNTIFDKE